MTPADKKPANPAQVTEAWLEYERTRIKGDNPQGHPHIYFQRGYEAALAAIGAGGQAVAEGLHLTEYEVQVLLGTSIHGCNMSPDRVFSLDMAWHRLYAIDLIDRPDGLAIVTEKGKRVIDAILSALAHPVQPGWRDGIALIAAERRRQIEGEGWSAERDDGYRNGELARAGGIYAVLAGADATDFRNAKDGYSLNDYLQALVQHYWPWDKSWLKITTRQRALEKAGACIAAELDRLIRLSAAPQPKGE